MKTHKIFRARTVKPVDENIAIRQGDDIVILKAFKGVFTLLEDNGKFYAIGIDMQPRRIDASEESIASALHAKHYFPPEPVKEAVAGVEPEPVPEPVSKPILRLKPKKV